jgi:hypothetical protein
MLGAAGPSKVGVSCKHEMVRMPSRIIFNLKCSV